MRNSGDLHSSNFGDLEEKYRHRRELALLPICEELTRFVRECLRTALRIDNISVRAKTVDSFVAKASKIEGGILKYAEPLSQIQDQIGCRIITHFLSDVELVEKIIGSYFVGIEHRVHIPDSESAFGYISHHHVLLLPQDVVSDDIDRELVPQFFELQIKTLFQHAWSEANHDLGYKPELGGLTSDQLRMLAFTSAQAWGADRAFDDLFREIHDPNGE